MPGWASVVRLFRRRLVLGLIFALSLTYCALSLFRHEKRGIQARTKSDDIDMVDDIEGFVVDPEDGGGGGGNEDDDDRSTGKSYHWQMQNPSDGFTDAATQRISNGSETDVRTCRNSVQGKALIVDERGLVCARREVLPSGCCTAKLEQGPNDVERERYSCETCNARGCCAVYEYCVSCCLSPSKVRKELASELEVRKLNRKSRKSEDGPRPRLRNLDRFQVCLATCRTSSASVQHENTYKDPHSKHCYDLQLPSNPYFHQRHRRDLVSTNNNDDNPGVVVTSSSVAPLLTPSSSTRAPNGSRVRSRTLFARRKKYNFGSRGDFDLDDIFDRFVPKDPRFARSQRVERTPRRRVALNRHTSTYRMSVMSG